MNIINKKVLEHTFVFYFDFTYIALVLSREELDIAAAKAHRRNQVVIFPLDVVREFLEHLIGHLLRLFVAPVCCVMKVSFHDIDGGGGSRRRRSDDSCG